jgi:hypothetical protein
MHPFLIKNSWNVAESRFLPTTNIAFVKVPVEGSPEAAEEIIEKLLILWKFILFNNNAKYVCVCVFTKKR